MHKSALCNALVLLKMPSSSDTNYAAVLHSTNDLRVEKVQVPSEVPEGYVKLGMRAVGICGSDMHFWKFGRIGSLIVKSPMILGHEGSGEVLETGPGVIDLQVGDRVAIEPGVPCECCSHCSTGRYNLCGDVKFAATPPVDGSLANYIVHPARYCYKLPENVSYEDAAMFEPLSVAIHTCRRANVKIGDKVFISGAGPVGLLCMLVAKAAGAIHVTMSDVDQFRLNVATDVGADDTLLVDEKGESQERASKIEASVCIEACGFESATKMCLRAAKRGGVVMIVGMGKETMELPLLDALVREVDIRGVFRYCNTYPTAVGLVSSGKINLRPFVTHRFVLKDALKAFETASTRDSHSIKVIIDCHA